MNTPLVNVICMKWGKLYGPEYVRALQRGVSRHLHRQISRVDWLHEAWQG